MNSNETIIRQAIDRSITHTERVHVEIDGDYDSLAESVSATWANEWDCCDENRDEQGRRVVDVWGYSDGTGDTMDWRLCVTLSPVKCEA